MLFFLLAGQGWKSLRSQRLRCMNLSYLHTFHPPVHCCGHDNDSEKKLDTGSKFRNLMARQVWTFFFT